MPPLQTPGIAYTSQKRCNKANVHGGAKISALRAGPCGPVALRNAPAGAAPAAPVCFKVLFLYRDRVWSMRRGGIYAARQGYAPRGVPGWLLVPATL